MNKKWIASLLALCILPTTFSVVALGEETTPKLGITANPTENPTENPPKDLTVNPTENPSTNTTTPPNINVEPDQPDQPDWPYWHHRPYRRKRPRPHRDYREYRERNNIRVISSYNGEVDVNYSYARRGTTVTITTIPDRDYYLDDIRVYDEYNDTVRVVYQYNNHYTFEMPSTDVEIEATFRPYQTTQTYVPQPIQTPITYTAPMRLGIPFVDIPSNAWYYSAVDYVYQRGLMGGDGDTLIFNPNGTTSKAMFITILYRLSGDSVTGTAYTDNWYTNAINWAVARNIITGDSEYIFESNSPITREQLAIALYRYTQYKGYSTGERADLSRYVDTDLISNDAQEAMRWAKAKGFMNGMTYDTLEPQSTVTRAQLAVTLAKYCQEY